MLPQITFNVWLYFNLILPLPSSGVPLISITEIVALAGEDVSLPCHLKPAVGAGSETVVWTKPGLDAKDINVQKDEQLMCQSQNPSYHYRTRLFKDEHGNIFLKLFAVRISDSGKYFCFLPSIQKEASVQLTVVSNCEKSRLICSHQPIVALAGDDAILPCQLEPAVSASSKTIVWTKPDLIPKYIHVHHEGQIMCPRQNPSYINRTNLFEQELKNGNLSLKLSSVKIQDTGKYFCQLQSMQEEASTQLTVGAVSTPIIQVVSNNSESVVLQCGSAGWYPEPEVFWLDGEGNLLSAGPTETVRGPDDLYTVSSRVTVEKRHSNNFTCRVQQKDINQTRETHIQVPADFFTVPSSFNWILIIICIIVLVIIIPMVLLKCFKKHQGEELEMVFKPSGMYTDMMHHNTTRI